MLPQEAAVSRSPSETRAREPIIARDPRHALPPGSLPVRVAAPAKPLPTTLEGLRRELAALAQSQAGVGPEFLAAVLALADDRAKAAGERIEAQRLLIETYRQMGQAELALAAYEQLLDQIERAKGKRHAVWELRPEIDRLFASRENWFAGVAACDLMLTRYADDPCRGHAGLMVARYYEWEGQPAQALSQYRFVASELAGTRYERAARESICIVLAGLGRFGDSLRELDLFASMYPDDDGQACAGFWQGWVHYRSGAGGYPAAVLCLRRVMVDYPGSRFAQNADRLAQRISGHVIREGVQGVM